jgi:bifunctional non-homologous end joining protein LigD
MLWRIPPKRSRRVPPAGFIHPARPTIVATPRSGPEWVHEIKHDGYRMLARKAANRVTLWSRYGTDFTDKLLRIAEAVRDLPVDDALLDGEAVVFKPDGHSDFAALRTRRGAEQAAFVTFDLLQMEGDDWRKHALEARRAQLESLVAGIDALIFSEAIGDEGALVFAHACKLCLEGVVSKRLGSRYRSGSSRTWLKCLNRSFNAGERKRSHPFGLPRFYSVD